MTWTVRRKSPDWPSVAFWTTGISTTSRRTEFRNGGATIGHGGAADGEDPRAAATAGEPGRDEDSHGRSGADGDQVEQMLDKKAEGMAAAVAAGPAGEPAPRTDRQTARGFRPGGVGP